MNTLHEAWLLSALLVLAAVTLAVIVSAVSALVDRGGRRKAPPGRPAIDLEPVTRPRPIERFVYRHHRAFGLAILAGSMLYLGLVARYGLLWPAGAGPVLGVLLPLLTLVNLTLLPFGTVMLLRPSLLKRVEAASNRWIEWDSGDTGYVLRIVVGLYCLAALIMLIAERLRGLVT